MRYFAGPWPTSLDSGTGTTGAASTDDQPQPSIMLWLGRWQGQVPAMADEEWSASDDAVAELFAESSE